MDSPYILYAIVTLAMLLFFGFCILTTWFFCKLVLGVMPRGQNNEGGNKKTVEGDKVSERGDG